MPDDISRHGMWSSRWLFVLAATGSAVGLGNIWKFPYITGENGGGAFVVVYLLCIAAIGIPVMMAEVVLGRAGRQSPINTLRALSRESGGRRLLADRRLDGLPGLHPDPVLLRRDRRLGPVLYLPIGQRCIRRRRWRLVESAVRPVPQRSVGGLVLADALHGRDDRHRRPGCRPRSRSRRALDDADPAGLAGGIGRLRCGLRRLRAGFPVPVQLRCRQAELGWHIDGHGARLLHVERGGWGRSWPTAPTCRRRPRS